MLAPCATAQGGLNPHQDPKQIRFEGNTWDCLLDGTCDAVVTRSGFTERRVALDPRLTMDDIHVLKHHPLLRLLSFRRIP